MFLSDVDRVLISSELEQTLWGLLEASDERPRKRVLFESYRDIALSNAALQRMQAIWSRELQVDGLVLSENDEIALSVQLAIKQPDQSSDLVAMQLQRTQNADRKRRLEFIAPALSADVETRDGFFASLNFLNPLFKAYY